jgi:hypothetical protein
MSVSPEKAPPLPRRSVANTLLQSVSSFVRQENVRNACS